MFRRNEKKDVVPSRASLPPRPAGPTRSENVVDGGVTLHADVWVDGSIVFHGTLFGNLKVQGSVYVGPKATIEGNVEADEARIEGKILGDLRAKERVDLLPGSRLQGDVHTCSLRIEEGAILRGTSYHGGDTWGEDD